RVLELSLAQLLPGVLDQQQTQVAQLRQVFFAHSSDDLELVLESLLPDPLDPFPARGGQARPHGPAIGGVGHPLDQAVALQVIDKAGDVPGRRLEVFGEVPQWSGAPQLKAKATASTA